MARDRLIARRKKRGFTQESLAHALSVETSTVWRWEHERSTPLHQRRELARQLDCSLDELAEWLGDGDLEPSESMADDLGVGLDYDLSIPATLDVVDELGRADMERRSFILTALFAVGASVAPSRDWLLATIDETAARPGKVGSDQVEAIRRRFQVFQELDVMRGGGHARRPLASYLTSHVTPLLRANDASTPTGRALFEVGAEQLYLIGWMAFDDGQHVLAQRYLIQALRLAQEAQSPELGAHVLAGLSDQANLTGNPTDALQLARAGRAGLKRGHSPACLADLWALQSRAEAVLGDDQAVERSVGLSMEAFEAVDRDEEPEPEWARFIDVAYLNGEYAHSYRDLDLSEPAGSYAALSAADARRQNRARRGSLAQATIARAALTDHDLPAAADAATTTVRLAATVRSSRSAEAVADLRARLEPHAESPPVGEFLELAELFTSRPEHFRTAAG